MMKLTPLNYDYVNRISKMKGMNMMTPVEYKNHVNISNADLFSNVFVLVVLTGAIVYLIMTGDQP